VGAGKGMVKLGRAAVDSTRIAGNAQQRGMRQFRTRGLQNVNNEFTLATLAYNITRLHVMRPA
jgi:hypothetical protein